MNTFDAPSREECRVRRERTNTPLQALLLMNDPQYVEAARYLADRTIESNSDGDRVSVHWMFTRAMGRPPTESELAVVIRDLDAHRAEFASNKDSATALVSIGETPANSKHDPVELASWTMIANLIMNMDEFVTKN